MDAEKFLTDYFAQFRQALAPSGIHGQMAHLRDEMLRVQSRGCKMMLAGNGASASIASHFALDFTKQARVRSISFNDSSFITAYGNDYGYENWVMKAVEHHGREGDAVILISSSGRSPNIVKAAQQARAMGIPVVTLTGFDPDNPLKSQGDINFWVNSRAYNIIESVHAFWMAATCDLMIGKSEYSVGA
jgi:D-sedoheptulose 7-phosphate isomerase